MYLLFFYLCLPFSMILLNSFLIRLLVIVSVGLFAAAQMIMNNWKQLAVFFLLFAFAFLYWLISWRTNLDSDVFVFYCLLSLVFVMGAITLYRSQDEAMLRRLFLFMTILFFVTAITSILGLRVYPLATRELGRGSTYDTSLDFSERKALYRRMNIVSWPQAYGMLFSAAAAMIVWKKKRKFFFLLYVFAVVVMLVASQLTFAVLLTAVLLAALSIRRESKQKTIILSVLLLLVAILLLLNLKTVLTTAVAWSAQTGLDFLSTKLNDLKILLTEKSAMGDASARGALYQKSLNTFLKSPVYGLIGKKASMEQIGFHSDFFDILGTFGLIGLIVVAVSFAQYRRFIHTTGKENTTDLTIVFLGFAGLFIFNPVLSSPQIFAGAFLYPLLAERYCVFNTAGLRLRIR